METKVSGKPPERFSAVLQDDLRAAAFRQFLEKERCDENLLFYIGAALSWRRCLAFGWAGLAFCHSSHRFFWVSAVEDYKVRR